MAIKFKLTPPAAKVPAICDLWFLGSLELSWKNLRPCHKNLEGSLTKFSHKINCCQIIVRKPVNVSKDAEDDDDDDDDDDDGWAAFLANGN